MASIRLILAGVLVVAALAGCASSQKQNLDSLYGAEAQTANIPAVAGLGNATSITLITGVHLEARLNDGAWGGNTTLALSPAPVNSPAMTGASPMGGGGETTALAVAANSTLEVRIKEADQLSGYTAFWYVMAGNATSTVKQPANQVFEQALGLGHFEVGVILSTSADDLQPAGIYQQTVKGAITAHFTITGQVQPVRAPAVLVAPPQQTPRDQMVDKYTLDLPAGAAISAVSSFDGTFAPGDGTDVDLGVFNGDGTGMVCIGSAGTPSTPAGPVVPDPSQSGESAQFTTDSAGLWSVQVGAMADNCPDAAGNAQAGWQYTNAGPVPYTLQITVG